MPDLNDDARHALRFANEHGSRLMAQIREQLPEGTHFGILILVPGESLGRVVAMTTDRQTVAFAAAQWVMSTIDPKEDTCQTE